MRPVPALLALALAAPAPLARADDLATAARKAADGIAQVLSASSDRSVAGKPVAVPPFAVAGGLPAAQGLAAAETFAQRLASAAKAPVLDPATVRGLVGEQKLQLLTGAAKADEVDLAGKAGALVSGQLALDGDRVKLSVKLVALPSGKTLGTAQATAEAPRPAAAAATPPAPTPPAESARIEVAMRKMADGLAGGFARLPGNARYRRLAVLPLGEVGDRAQKQKLGTIVAAELATDLRRDHGLLLVEREKLGQVLGELKLQQMVSPDAGQAAQIGQLADAQAIVVGTVAEAGDRYLVTARIVATQTGEALAAESASVPAAGLVALASDAVVLRSRGDAAFRSLVVPGLGQAYNRQPGKAVAFAATTLGLAGGAVAFHLAGRHAWSDYRAATAPAEATRLYDDARSRYRTRDWLAAGAALAWAASVVDAWASGVDGEKALGGGVAAAPVVLPDGAGLALAARW